MTVVASERRRHLANVIAIAKSFANWTETLPSSKSRDTKTRIDIKNLLHTKIRYCSLVSESVVICQLTLKMAEEIDFENWRISNFKGLVTLTLAYRSALLIDLYLHTKFHRNRKNFLWTDGRTDIWPMLLGRRGDEGKRNDCLQCHCVIQPDVWSGNITKES